MARFLPKHIPGNPKLIVRNIEGHLAGCNQMYVTEPDGLTMACSVFASQARKDPAVKYDLRKLEMLGQVERGLSVIMITKEALPRSPPAKASSSDP